MHILSSVKANARIQGLADSKCEVEPFVIWLKTALVFKVPEDSLFADVWIYSVEKTVAAVAGVDREERYHDYRHQGTRGSFEVIVALVGQIYLLAVYIKRLKFASNSFTTISSYGVLFLSRLLLF